MKKLMIAAAAAVCGSVFGLESANVVGYASSQLDNAGGSVLTTPQFISTSGSGVKLKDIVPVAEGYEIGDMMIDIQYVDNAGYTDVNRWYCYDGMGGWYYNDGDKIFEDASEEVINPGDGFAVGNTIGSAAVVRLQSAGQVNTSDVLVKLDDAGGSIATGNPFPVSLKLGDITPQAEGYEIGDMMIDIQYVDNAGYTDVNRWYCYDGMGGWYYNDGEKIFEDASEEVINPGDGFAVGNTIGSAAEVKLRFPAPEL